MVPLGGCLMLVLMLLGMTFVLYTTVKEDLAVDADFAPHTK